MSTTNIILISILKKSLSNWILKANTIFTVLDEYKISQGQKMSKKTESIMWIRGQGVPRIVSCELMYIKQTNSIPTGQDRSLTAISNPLLLLHAKQVSMQPLFFPL